MYIPVITIIISKVSNLPVTIKVILTYLYQVLPSEGKEKKGRTLQAARRFKLENLSGLQPWYLQKGSLQVYKFNFDLQPGSLTDQVAGEHQPSKKHS